MIIRKSPFGTPITPRPTDVPQKLESEGESTILKAQGYCFPRGTPSETIYQRFHKISDSMGDGTYRYDYDGSTTTNEIYDPYTSSIGSQILSQDVAWSISYSYHPPGYVHLTQEFEPYFVYGNPFYYNGTYYTYWMDYSPGRTSRNPDGYPCVAGVRTYQGGGAPFTDHTYWYADYGTDIYALGWHWLYGFSGHQQAQLLTNLRDRHYRIYSMWLLFENVLVPRGATITESWLQLFPKNPLFGAGQIPAFVVGAAQDDADYMEGLGGTGDPYYNIPFTQSQVDWPISWQYDNETQTRLDSPDIACIIQEMVDRPGWQPGNSILLRVVGEANAAGDAVGTFWDHWNNSIYAPELWINHSRALWEFPSGGISVGGSPFYLHIMMGGIKMGGGSTVTGGRQTFNETMLGGAVLDSQSTIRMHYSSEMSAGVRLDSSARVTQSPKSYSHIMSGGILANGTSLRSTSYTMMGGITVGGNPYGYSCNARGTGTKVGCAYGFEVTTSDNDSMWNYTWTNNGQIGLDRAGTSMWLRFPNVDIWKGNTVNYACVFLYQSRATPSTVYATIRAQDTANATVPLTVGDITNRPRGSQGVDWTLSDTNLGTIESPNIACVIQEIIDKSTWSPNNSILLFFDNPIRNGSPFDIHEFVDASSETSENHDAQLVVWFYGSSSFTAQGGMKCGGSATIAAIKVERPSGGVVVMVDRSGYLDAPNTAALYLRDATVSFWMKSAKTGTQTVISGANTDRDNELTIMIEDDKIRFDNHYKDYGRPS